MMKSVALGLVLVVSAGSPNVSTGPQEINSRLDEAVHDYEVSDGTFARALILVASQFQIPIGVEWTAPTAEETVRLSWKDATVRQVLESIVRSRPGYSIRFTEGKVHVSYQGADSDRTNFLNLKLENFSVKQTHIGVALYQLRQSVLGHVTPQGKRGEITEIALEPNDHLISEDFRNSTVRKILDDLTFQSDSKMWVVTFPQGAGLTATGYRRTCTIWNDARVPDSEQPIWDRFRWGMPLPPYRSERPVVKSTREWP